MTRYITIRDNVVVAIRFGKSIIKDETKSDRGNLGDIYNKLTDSFTTPAIKPEAEIDVTTTIQEIKDHYTTASVLMDKIKTKLGIV